MSARSKARKRALDILFQADIRDVPLSKILEAEATRAVGEPAREASWLYARDIIDGISVNSAEIDEQITACAHDWTLARMPAVDRAVLRIAVWEMQYNDQVPVAVAIDEAVQLAKEYSTDESGAFVHGVLARISRND